MEKNRYQIKLVKTIIDFGDKFNGYSISPKIRPILLHCGYELTEKIFYQLNKLLKKIFSLV